MRHPRHGARHRAFLHTQHFDDTVASVSGLGDRHFDALKELEYEVASARIWGGIHFRSAVDDGVEIGKKTADHVLAHHFATAK